MADSTSIKLSSVLVRFAVIVIPVFAISTILTMLYLRQDVDLEQRLLKDTQTQFVRLLRTVADYRLQAILTDLEVLASSPQLEVHLADESPQCRKLLGKQFKAYCRYKNIYDQVRFLDSKGMEIMRANCSSGHGVLVPADKLQNKSQRYYFKEAIKLERGQIFLSPMDLNIEWGEVERPFKPVMRMATPVFDREGNKRGIVLLNYLGRDLMETWEQALGKNKHQFMLLNSDGYWLRSPNRNDEWGWMLPGGRDNTFALRHPRDWEKISQNEEGQFLSKQGLISFSTVRPLLSKIQSRLLPAEDQGVKDLDYRGQNYHWKIVSLIPPEIMEEAWHSAYLQILPIYLLLSLVEVIALGVVAYLWARSKRDYDERETIIQELQTAQAELKRIATHDALTGVANRRQLDDWLVREWKRSEREEQPMAVAMVDIDFFKLFNDSHGHQAGDECLRQVALKLEASIRRPGDYIGRYGGEEFMIILSNTVLDGAVQVAETMCRMVRGARIKHGASEVHEMVTISVGVASTSQGGFYERDSLVAAADEALYRAKQEGRNRVMAWQKQGKSH